MFQNGQHQTAVSILITVLSLVTLCYSDWDSNCLSCECKWSSGKKVANCTNAKLNSIPQNLHAEVQVLILDYNFISTLGENIFIRNLPNLQKISLRHCGIKTINEKAFNGLKILVEVDLSHNNITKFGSRTFSGNNRLKTINLSHNPIRNLVEFQFPVLPYLKTLDFSDCVIEHIDRKAFGNLGNSIETISLKGNRLTSLQEDIFLSTTNIKSLELHLNPWRCDCHLKQFRDWVVDKGLYNYPTTCKDPERLSDKMWDVVHSTEFACKPQIEVSQRRVYSQPGANVTLSCFITGNPVPEAKWVLRGRIVTNNTSPLYSGSNENIQYVIHEKGGFERWFNLTVVNISEEDADDYTCVGVNAGGVSEQNVSLTFDQPKISPDTHEPVETTNNLVAIIGAVALAASLSLLSCSLYCCCRNKCIKRSGEQDSYSGSIVGISSSDQQSLIQPKSILKQTSSDQSRYNDTSGGCYTGQIGPGPAFPGAGPLVPTATHRSLAESSTSGISQATLHSYDVTGHYPDLLDIPNRDMQTSPTTNATTATSTFTHKIMDVSTIRLGVADKTSQPASQQETDLICTCPHPPGGHQHQPPVSQDSYSVIATAAILPPPPNFLCSEMSSINNVQTVPINKFTPTPCFVTLPRKARRELPSGQEEEVRLVPYFDGVGPRTSAKGSLGAQSAAAAHQVGPEMIEALPPPPMFCSVCENDTGGKFGGSNCCAMEDTLVTKDRKVNRSSKKCFIGSENSFSTLPNVRSHSFSTKKPRKEDCKAGIQV